MAAFSGAAGRSRRRNRRGVVLRPAGTGGLDGRPDSARIPVTHDARSRADRAVCTGRAGDRADELHRNDCCGSRLCPPWRTSHRCESRTDRHRGRQSRRRAARCDAGRWRHLTDRGRARNGRALAGGVARHRQCRGRNHAAARAVAGLAASRYARSDRHRLLGRADPARGIPCHSQGAHDGFAGPS